MHKYEPGVTGISVTVVVVSMVVLPVVTRVVLSVTTGLVVDSV